ncbi:hypothetical protein GCM10023191_026100 [Actinoallomurus oryzae]|uniref:Cas12f1-like TNB domain-containing protein n=1 Tax=Actinoallomurus oryzae TaxID=502180 RepID=A0ABP8PSQ5_9ACTN
MRRSFKFLLRPTGKQAVALTQCLEDHRELCNAALEHRRTACRKAGVRVRYGDQSAELKHIRADDLDGQGRWSFSSQQARWDSRPHHPTVTYVRLQGVGHVRVHRHRRVLGTVKTIGVRREGARWFVVLSCDDVPAGRRRKAVARVAALHAKVRRQRLDSAHKAALRLVRDHDVIADEALKVTDMTERAAPKPDGGGGHLPNGAAAKSGLNRSILDAGWGVFLTILSHKAESAGRELIAVNPANTSRTCAECGHCAKENRITQAVFGCTACGHTAHADVNAAINILRAGLALRDAAQAA